MMQTNMLELNSDSSLAEAMLFFLKSSGLEEAIKAIVQEAVNESFGHKEVVKTKDDSLYYTRSELCQLAHITETTLWRLEKEGVIRKIKFGRKNLYSRLDVDALLGSGGFKFSSKKQSKVAKPAQKL